MTPDSVLEKHLHAFDDRRSLAIPGNREETVTFATEYLLTCAASAISERGVFTLALSGGSTPKAIYTAISNSPASSTVDWAKVLLFWSDERCVAPDSPDSNYLMAMTSGLQDLGIPKDHIFRMRAEENILDNALIYEEAITDHVPGGQFDVVMLGMGGDGHTASLFPHTHGLHTRNRLAIANYVPQLDTWRMTLTFDCINAARNIWVYVLGADKREVLYQVLCGSYTPDSLPSQKLGTSQHKALWIADSDGASKVLAALGKK